MIKFLVSVILTFIFTVIDVVHRHIENLPFGGEQVFSILLTFVVTYCITYAFWRKSK